MRIALQYIRGRDMKNCVRKHCFNMVEIVLAIGVIAIGVISIMALFPVGIQAGRDAMATDYSAHAADQLLHWLEYQIRNGTWSDYMTTGGSKEIPEYASRPDADDFDLSTASGHDASGTLYWKTGASPADTVYKIIRYHDANSNNQWDAGELTDFEAIAVVWRSQVTVPGQSGPQTLPYTTAAALNLEISWPAQLPYGRRTKKTYTLELFNR